MVNVRQIETTLSIKLLRFLGQTDITAKNIKFRFAYRKKLLKTS